jgi:hypothetical protein
VPTRQLPKAAVIAAVVIGTLTSGVGRADAAVPSRVTRMAQNISVGLEVRGPGVNFKCSNILYPHLVSVDTPLGVRNSSGHVRFKCTSGSNYLGVVFKISSYYRSDGYSSANFPWLMDFNVAGIVAPQCTNTYWTTPSQRNAFITSTIYPTWFGTQAKTENSIYCGGYSIFTKAHWDEGWSTS